MLEQTKAAVRAILAADSTVEKEEMKFWTRQLARPEPWKAETPPPIPRRMTRREVMDATGLSSATISKLAANGTIEKVLPKGNVRGMGFTEASVRAFLAGSGKAVSA